MFDLKSFTAGVLYSLSRQGVALDRPGDREYAERELTKFVDAVAPGTLTRDQVWPPKLGAADNPGVHETHCCPAHGCKYHYADCPVKAGTLAPEFPNNNGCEQCEFDADEEYENEGELNHG